MRIISAREVMIKIGVSWPTLWAWSKCGKFPAPRQISSKKIGWIEAEVDAWIANLPVRQLSLKEDDASEQV
jgi:predicted DNA-binding transcriptional regulator AlpA